MFREMRRKDRKLELDEVKKILLENTYGVLSLINADNGYPYGLPISYSYMNDEIYIHSAIQGLKVDSIKKDNRVCFTVIGETKVLPDKFSINYESVIVYGKIIELVEENKNIALYELIKKYSADFLEEGKIYIEKAGKATKVYKIEVEHMSGKARR